MGQQSENEWIEWAGGECPVPADTRVCVRFRDGETQGPVMACAYADPELSNWAHVDSDPLADDIIAYRVVPARSGEAA
jgi:hypothetical protein